MLFLFVFHEGYKPRKNAKKEAKISQDYEEVEPGQWLLAAVEKLRATAKGSL